MYFKCHGVGRVPRVIPGAGFQFDNARANMFSNDDTGQTSAAIIRQPDDIAVCDIPFCRIEWVHPGRRPVPDLGVTTGYSMIVLAMQSCFRLVGDQVQGIVFRPLGAQPLLNVIPFGVARAIIVVEPGNLFRIQFNSARGGA